MTAKWIVLSGLLAFVLGGCAIGDDGDSASKAIPQATPAQLAAAGLDELPLAPKSARVDLEAAPFSNSTNVTNPLFPISDLHSAILNGTVDDKTFKTETTLLPYKRIIEWDGWRIEALVSQYVAYLDGRIEEVALDYYAQADDGSVWYLGEDVFNYRDGVVADREGTWLAGREGPPAMIMPSDPRAGDVYFPENVPGLVFEQVTVKDADRTVQGPQGPVEGAIVGGELHQDGSREDKTFAPGYGEFFTGSGGDVEALALAVPTDELPGGVPAELAAISRGADELFANPKAPAVAAMQRAWTSFKGSQVPPRLKPAMDTALERLDRAAPSGNGAETRHAAVDVAQAALDLELRYRPPAEIDRARLDLWAHRLLLDAADENGGGVAGDLATMEWIRDRIAHTIDPVRRAALDHHLVELRGAVTDEDLPAAAAEATAVRKTLAGVV